LYNNSSKIFFGDKMKEKIIDWFHFHVEILERYKLPYFVWGIGLLAMLVAQHFYFKAINGIYNFQLFGNFPFRQTIETHIYFVKHGMWLIPMVALVFFIVLGIQIHQRNIQRVYRY